MNQQLAVNSAPDGDDEADVQSLMYVYSALLEITFQKARYFPLLSRNPNSNIAPLGGLIPHITAVLIDQGVEGAA